MENPGYQIFVIGSPRSGTSIVGNALKEVLDLNKDISEFHLFTLHKHLLRGVNGFCLNPTSKEAFEIQGMLLNKIGEKTLKRRINGYMRNLYKSFLNNSNFVDKSPGIEMVQEVPQILNVWPNAKIIFAKRRGIENIQSRLRKFRDINFENHCRQWANTMMAWSQVKDKLINSSKEKCFIEIDQYDLVKEPRRVSLQLQTFLELSEKKAKEIEQYFFLKKPEKTSENFNFIDFDELDWSPQNKSIYKEICEQAMQIFDYSYSSNYYKSH